MLSIFLMISRLVLVLQYFLVMWLTRKYKHHALPIGLLAGTYFLAAMVYLGLFFTFHLNLRGVNHSYIFWYITAILETIIATGISSVWRNISFKGTHLVERMSLLTLIILGEGVIGIAKSFQKIVQSEGALRFTASTVANVVCAVLILYMIYMIYFDWNDEEHFGTIRQQIWSALHFPLHLALVLAVEGVSQCITWRAAVVQGNRFNKQFGRWNEDLGDGLYTEVAESINTTAIYLIHRGLLTSKSLDQTMEMLTHDLGNINNATNIIRDGGEDPVLARDALYWTYFTLYRTIYNIAGFDSPAKHSPSMNATAAMPDEVDFADEVDAEKAVQSITQTADVFNLIYVYFFTSIGLVIILCCVIAALSNRQKSKLQNLRLIGSGLIGLGLGLLSIADSTVSGTRFAFSAFLLPTVALAMAIVVVFNAIKPVLPKMPGFSRVRSTSRGRERSV
jgi:low temperature requirement protein LtrA